MCSSWAAFPFPDKKNCFQVLHQSKLQGIQDVVNRDKISFGSYGDLVDRAFSQFNENYISNQDSILKMMKYQGQSTLMKMIQKTQK